ncbi:MAG: chorismate lyase [Steroidobacteraceae bacterium]|nr:chorismate lyase [Steroidobacteraceae bacterium]
MTGRAQDPASGPAGAGGAWVTLDECLDRAPAALHLWLAEPGLLTTLVRRACGCETQFRLLRVEHSPLSATLAHRMGVADTGCLVREIEFACGSARWVFAQSVFPDSTVRQHPWLAELGNVALGESLLGQPDVSRQPLEYREIAADEELAVAAGGLDRPAWARRAVYRLSMAPIMVQEMFLPALINDGRAPIRPGSTA